MSDGLGRNASSGRDRRQANEPKATTGVAKGQTGDELLETATDGGQRSLRAEAQIEAERSGEGMEAALRFNAEALGIGASA